MPRSTKKEKLTKREPAKAARVGRRSVAAKPRTPKKPAPQKKPAPPKPALKKPAPKKPAPKKPAPKKPPPRPRRSPEEAKTTILEAARRLLSERGPDAVGLKDVARAAGVSHALVSHYFGTYGELVEAVMEAHVLSFRTKMLADIASSPAASPAAWVDRFFEQLSDPLHARLSMWAVLSGRFEREDFFSRRHQGLRLVADALELRMGELLPGAAPPSREDLERLLALVIASATGYSAMRSLIWPMFGRAATPERDRAFRELLLRAVFREAASGARP